MSYALGQPVPLQALVRDANGDLDDATTVTLTITLPDGTTATPTVTNPPATTGTYELDYLPATEGLYGVRWVFTGVSASAPPVDSFYVDGTVLPPLASLAEARQQCRAFTTDDDALLQRYLMVASAQCERHTQVWRRQTISLVKSGGARYVKLRAPIISVTSVTESGVAVASTGYTAHPTLGWLYRGDGISCERWAPGIANIAVTYVAGAADGLVPDEIRQGVKQLVEHLWNTQRGGAGLPRNNGGSDWQLPAGFTIPNAVLEQWRPWIPELVA
jgi:hypothetical protein